MDIDELARGIAAGKPITSLNVRDDRWPEVDCDGAVFTDCVFEAVQFSYPSFVDALLQLPVRVMPRLACGAERRGVRDLLVHR